MNRKPAGISQQPNREQEGITIRPYYADYVNHMLRHYCRHPEGCDESAGYSDRENWKACDTVLRRLKDSDREVLTEIYKTIGGDRPIIAAVQTVAEKTGRGTQSIHDLIRAASLMIKEERGL